MKEDHPRHGGKDEDRPSRTSMGLNLPTVFMIGVLLAEV